MVGYYVAAEQLDHEAILLYLSEHLPEYMIPTALVWLEKLPLTINGKLDRKALPEPELITLSDYIAPRNDLEKKLCAIYAEVLGVSIEKVSINDDFFYLGGDSIVSIQLVSRLRQQLAWDINVKDVFEQKTIEKLCIKALSRQDSDKETVNKILTEDRVFVGQFDLLPIQEWFFSKVRNGLFKQPWHWNQAFLIKTANLDQALLKLSLIKLIEYHDCFRLNYQCNNGIHYTQFYNSTINEQAIHIEYLNVNQLSNNEYQQALTEWQNHFELFGDTPLYQVGYLDGHEDGSSRIFFALHHLLIDSVSWRIIIYDLQKLYNTLNNAKKNHHLEQVIQKNSDELLGNKGTSYRQWIALVKEYAHKHNQEQIYWQRNVADLKDSEKRLVELMDKGATHHAEFSIDKQSTKMLMTNCNKAYHTEINDLLLSAFGLAIAKVTGNDINYITLESHGREEITSNMDITRTVGWFTTLYPVPLTTVTDNFDKTIIAVKEQLRSIPNNGIGYGALFGYVNPELPRINFNYLGQLDQSTSGNDNNWKIVQENTGTKMHVDNVDNNIINADGFVTNGELKFMITGRLKEQEFMTLVTEFQHKLNEMILYLMNKDKIYYSINDFLYDFSDIYTIINSSEANKDNTIFLLPPGNGGYESYLSSIVPNLKGYNLILFNNYYLHIASKINVFKENNNIDFAFLAKFYIQFIKKIKPNGPYNLFGWSYGGVLSFEIARQLELAGDKINYLGLLDSFFNYKSASDALELKDPFHTHNINYQYTPEHYFNNNSKAKIVLYKATKNINSNDFNNVLKLDDFDAKNEARLYEYYVNSQDNFIHQYLGDNSFKVININSNHINWVNDKYIIDTVCEAILNENKR